MGSACDGRAEAVIDGGKVVLTMCVDRGFCSQLERNGYLKSGVIDGLEAFYQASKGVLCIDGSGGWVASLQVIHRLGINLDIAIVFSDLRRKGRKPREGVRRGTLVYTHGGVSYEVLVLSEGYPVALSRLVEWSRGASLDNHRPVVAVVDRTGLVTYYEAKSASSLS